MTARTSRPLTLAAVLAALAVQFASRADDKKAEPAPKFTAEQVRFYEKEVLPVLQQHCLKCHGADPDKIKGELNLATRAGVLTGGDSGRRSI
jgi:mono/diheme cytochrome c family protein